MIEPNWDLLLWFILIGWVLGALFGIPALASKWDETKKYGYGEVFHTIFVIVAVVLILVL